MALVTVKETKKIRDAYRAEVLKNRRKGMSANQSQDEACKTMGITEYKPKKKA